MEQSERRDRRGRGGRKKNERRQEGMRSELREVGHNGVGG